MSFSRNKEPVVFVCCVNSNMGKTCKMKNFREFFSLLPPASEGGGKVIFSVCLSVHTGGGYPSPRFFPRSLIPGAFWGVPHTWSGATQCQDWGTPPPPPQDRLRCGRYASCGFPQEDFLLIRLYQPVQNIISLNQLTNDIKGELRFVTESNISRNIPKAKLPHGVSHKIAANYYCTRDARRESMPDEVIYIAGHKALESGEPKEPQTATEG